MSYSVFLSSTQKDLKPFREAVSRALKEAGYEVVEMETFGARSEVPLDVCRQAVADARVFVGIYARRYGFIPPDGEGISITEHEYREARRVGLRCLCYLLKKEADWPAELCEPEATAALERFKAQIQREVTSFGFSTLEELPGEVVANVQAASGAREDPARRELLDHVQRMCIDQWLNDKAPKPRLHVRRKDWPGKPEAENPPDDPAAHTGVVVPIRYTYADKLRQLLILGRNGAGKTVALLELCDDLWQDASRDPGSQVPVILSLGSWRWHNLSFETWMKRQIDSKYRISRDWAKKLVDEEMILPLFDGLDEVDPTSRSACVDKIRSFLESRKRYKHVAVCCQSQACDELLKRLDLYGAVSLQPLTREQIVAYLAAAGPELAALREAVEADEQWLKQADTPLMLTRLKRTCRGADPAAVRALLSGPAEQVIDDYVTRMLEPKLDLPRAWVDETEGWFSRLLKPGSYPQAETRRRLAWLARRMREHDPELLPERLQPSWLPTAGHRLAYAALSRALSGLLLLAPLAFLWESVAVLGFGLLVGALAGALDAPRLRRSSALGQEDRTLAQNLRLSLLRILLLGGGVFLPWLAAGWIWQWLGGEGISSDLPRVGAFLGTLFGLALGTRSAGRDGSNDIRIRVQLQVGRWSWRGMLWGAVSLFALSLVYCALAPRVRHFPVLWAAAVTVATVVGAVGGGALGALEDTPVPKSTAPNRGIRWTLFNAALVGLTVAAVLALTLGGLRAAFLGLRASHDWRVLFEAAATAGLWAGLWYSGLDFVQHWTLRLLLWAAGLMPLRLIHFLSYLTVRGLMQRTGGWYRFESQLLDHFAPSDRGTDTTPPVRP